MRAALAAYQCLGWLGLGLGWPFLLAIALRDRRFRQGWKERLGIWSEVPGAPNGVIWVHGASVGEVQVATPLVKALKDREQAILFTTTSPSGRGAARSLVAEQGSARLLPLDLAPLIRRCIRISRPRALVIVETELWPALLWEARKASVPCLLVNGRISDRTLPRYRRLRRWVSPILRGMQAIHARSASDAERFLDLGAPAGVVSVGGDMKFDLPDPDPSAREVSALRRARAGGWRVLLGGSTHAGEEEALLEAAGALESSGLRTGLVIAPRHLERLSQVEQTLRCAGRGARRWSSLGEPLEAGIFESFSRGDVILVDGYGLLAKLYGGAEIAFVGGTLAPVGGHNLLEPLNWGVPVLFGPHTENAREVSERIRRLGLGEEVSSPQELAAAADRTLRDAGRLAAVRTGALRLFEENRGAVSKAVSALVRMGALPGRAGA